MLKFYLCSIGLLMACNIQAQSNYQLNIQAKPFISYNQCEKEIKIQAHTDVKGTEEEEVFVKQNYPTYHILEQRLAKCGGHMEDILTLVNARQEKIEVYFNIENSFGKS